jgi:hypothetical protein
MNLNVPPPMSDPELEVRHGQSPKQRLEGMVFGLLVITVLVVIYAGVKLVL